MLEFDVGVLGRELPVSFGMLGIAVSLPCGELVQEDLLVGDAAVETLRRENGEFGIRHIEPTGGKASYNDCQWRAEFGSGSV